MLNIPLIESWRLKSDSRNIILVRESGGQEAEAYYYWSIEAALQALIDKKIKGFNATSVLGLMESIKHLQQALNRAIAPLKLRVVALSEQEEVRV